MDKNEKKLLFCLLGLSNSILSSLTLLFLLFCFDFGYVVINHIGRDRCLNGQAWRRRRRRLVRCRPCPVPAPERTRWDRTSRQRDRRGRHQPPRHHGPGPDASRPHRPDPVRLPTRLGFAHRDPAAADRDQEDGLWSRCGRRRSGPADRGLLRRRSCGAMPGSGHEGHGGKSRDRVYLQETFRPGPGGHDATDHAGNDSVL